MTALGIVTGLRLEARTFEKAWGPNCPPVIAAPGAAAAAAARHLVADGASGLVSFGTAGGLDSALTPGALVVASTIAGASSTFRLSTAAVLATEIAAMEGAIASVSAPLLEPHAKQAMAAHGFLAVDMESALVAAIAAELGVRAAVIRAVADPVGRSLPSFAPQAIDAHGDVRMATVLSALLATPSDWAKTVHAARDTARARASLGRAAAAFAALAREGRLHRLFDVPVEDVDRGPLR